MVCPGVVTFAAVWHLEWEHVSVSAFCLWVITWICIYFWEMKCPFKEIKYLPALCQFITKEGHCADVWDIFRRKRLPRVGGRIGRKDEMEQHSAHRHSHDSAWCVQKNISVIWVIPAFPFFNKRFLSVNKFQVKHCVVSVSTQQTHLLVDFRNHKYSCVFLWKLDR